MIGGSGSRAIFLLALVSGCSGIETEEFEAGPRVMQIFSLFPSGGQRGTASDVEVLGANLDGLQRVEADCEGVTAAVLSSSYLSARLRFTVAAEAPIGLCRVRMFSAIGISNLQLFRVDQLPGQLEREPNNSPETAQPLRLPCIINGRLNPDEDVDFYAIRGEAGEQITAEVFAARNGSGLNPEMYLLNEAGLRLAVGVIEESSDAVIRYRLPSSGDYRLAIRGTFGVLNISFPTGHPAYVYQLKVTSSAPILQTVRPFHVVSSGTSRVRISGSSLSSVDALVFSDPGMSATIVERSLDQLTAQVRVAAVTQGTVQMWAVAGPLRSPPVNVLSTPRDDRAEIEPNHSIEDAVELTLDDAIAGRISTAGELDYFVFKAPEEGSYVWELQAGRFPSLLDPTVEVLDRSGKALQAADGAPGSDLTIERRLRKDEEVCVRVKQSILNYYGPAYTYRLFVRKARPMFAIAPGSRKPTPKQMAGADRIYLARGSQFSVPLKIQWAEGFEETGASIHVDVEGLPEGVTVDPLVVTAGDGKREKEKGPLVASKDLVFHATPTAPGGAARIRVRGKSRWPGGTLLVYEKVQVNAGGTYVLSLSGGSPQQIDCRYLNVIEPVRYELRPEIGDERYPSRFSLRPGSQKPLLVTLFSREPQLPEMEFEAENLPRGVRLAGAERLAEKNQYRLLMEASADAERGWRPIVMIIAHAKQQDAVLTTPYFGMTVQ